MRCSLSHLSDETLCSLAANGNASAEEALVTQYSRLVRICARPLFLAGGDGEDLIQEGMLGLLTAIREFNANRNASFRTFAALCIRRRLYSAIRAAARDKHTPLNQSVSFETPLFEQVIDYSLAQRSPEDVIIDREAVKEHVETLHGELSGFESQVLGHYLNGLSYGDIARETHKPTKSVDNAVQRIRRKLARQ